jgi:hypothetical protein
MVWCMDPRATPENASPLDIAVPLLKPRRRAKTCAVGLEKRLRPVVPFRGNPALQADGWCEIVDTLAFPSPSGWHCSFVSYSVFSFGLDASGLTMSGLALDLVAFIFLLLMTLTSFNGQVVI